MPEVSEMQEGAGCPKKEYDVVVVLGSGMWMDSKKRMRSSTFGHDFGNGATGANARVLAAAELFARKASKVVILSGGAPKAPQRFGITKGVRIPSEAEVMRNDFQRRIKKINKHGLYQQQKTLSNKIQWVRKRIGTVSRKILIEPNSRTTQNNIVNVLDMAHEKGWSKVAIVTSDYHTDRLKLMCEEVLKQYPDIRVEYIGAETYLGSVYPGMYDPLFERVQKTDLYIKRLAGEEKGKEAYEQNKYRSKTKLKT